MPMIDDGPEPLPAIISSVAVVTILLSDYADLLDCKRRLAMLDVGADRMRAELRSRVDRDPEVAAFLAENFGRMLLKEVYSACRERFGADRTPGRSTIARFWERIRANAG